MINPIETIRIYNPVGQAYYSDAAKTNIEFPVTNSCERSAKLMGDDYVRLVFKLPNKVVFDTYAFIEYDGQTFFLKETYRPTPNGCLKETIDGKESVSSAYYSYDVKFVSIANMLTKPICYRHVVVKGAGGTQQTWDEPEISINGTLETLYQIIIGSIQQAASRLSASHYKDMLTSIAANGAFTNGAKPDGVQLTPNTKLVTFSFSGDNIANVCTSVANAYTEDGKDTEWYITEDAKHSCTLHFAKCESADTAQVLSDYEWENNGADRFARPYLNGGLKSVEYAQAWSDVPQVIVPYGADRNMSGISVVGIDETTQMQSTFGKRLRLDPNTTYNVHDKNGENTATITTDAHGAISNPNVNTGIEITKFYNDIYPQCHFKITKVEVKNKRQSGETVPEYTCEGIAVDARYTKEYLAQKGMFPLRIEEATTLSVRFESGFLNGREFEIANKTHKDQGSTGYSLKFTIVADGSIEDGTLIPSGNFKPNVGDQFALFNMKMPAEFVSLAKQDLAQRAYEELLDLQNTRPEVKCTAEPFTFMQHTVAFGAVMQVSSELFGDKPFVSRVIAYSYKLTSPSNVQFSLASAVMQGTLSEMNNAISDVTQTAGGLEQRAINLSRRGWRDANEVADMLDSITSEMMLVGNERYQFGFTSSIECVDSSNKFASLRIGYGSLQHTQEPYINYANRGLWEISGATLTKDVNGADLDPNTPYYLFAQVADDTNPARLILTTDAHSSESEDDVPYLLLGILSSEFEDRRVFSRTNGYTAIEGGTITTEQIQDASRNLIIDFQSNPPRIIARNGAEIIGNVRFKASDTKTAEEQLRDLGIDVGNAQSTANDAQTAANEANAEAEKVRAEYQAAITAEEQARNTAITSVQNSIGSLQNQIDGEVTAWFLKGVPTLDNQPAADWEVLNDNGTVDTEATELEYKRHEGDTYTNMSSYEEDSENAGKSWRFCKGVEDTPKSGWHWHLIADSDAVKALVEAGKAQSTADGKSTTFVKKPTSYQVGDLWILQADTDHTEGKKGDILTANVSSATYNANHWSKDVKYTDDTVANQAISDAANAKSAADNAKSVADAATTRLNNWAEDGVISPAEKQGIKDEIARIDADKSHITSEYTKYGLGTPTAFNTAHTDYRAILVTLSSSATETITIPSNFSTKQTTYYNARTTALTAISTKADETAKAYADTVSASAAQAALDNLEIGGRNLLTGTSKEIKCVTTYNYGYNIGDVTAEPNATYTYRAYVKVPADSPVSYGAYFTFWTKSSFKQYGNQDVRINPNEEGYTTITCVAPSDATRIRCDLRQYDKDSGKDKDVNGIELYVKEQKLEKGNKPTDWTPAPEDVEASIAENKTYADGIVKALGENLQNQIDGVVDSYFREGAPTATNYPANEWTTDELKQRHEGDTYTNIQQYTKLGAALWEQGSFNETQTGKEWTDGQAKYNSNSKNIRLIEVIPNRKGYVVHLSDYKTYKLCVIHFNSNKKTVDFNFWKTADFTTSDYPYIAIAIARIDGTQASIADVADSGVVINPDAGKSWRWCKGSSDTPATTWHWHEVADSDAVRALQDAAKAQDTADGKRRVFITQPTPPYDKGDLWAQGSADGQEIKRCMTARATGSYNASDWQSASSALSKATAAATEAATAKTNAQTALTTLGNIASDTVLTKQEKVAVRTEWASIQAEYTKNTANAKVCWGDTGYSSNTDYKTYSTAYSGLSTYLTSTAKINDSTDTTIVPANFNSAFSSYYGANVVLLNAIAKRVSELEAQAAVDNIEVGGENLYTGANPLTIKATTSDFNYVTLVRGLQNNARYIFSCGKSVVKASNTTQYAVLLYDFTNSTSQQRRLLPVGSTRVEQAFTIPSTGTWDMLIYSGVNGSTAGISMEYTDIMVQKGNKATEYQKPIRKFLYNGNVSIPYKNTDYAQSKLLASGVYAGTYYTEMASESKGAGVTTANREAFTNSCLVWFVAGKQQTTENVLKITDWGEAVNISQRADVYVYTGQAAFVKSHIQDPTSTGVEFAASGTWTIQGAQISTYKMEYLESEAYEAKTKAEALDYLKAAMANGSTEVAGGLLMTNVLMLRDLANTVTAGLSGLTKYKPAGSSITLEDLVLLWGGGTYDEAFYAARNANYLKNAGGTPITTLLKKNGTGKIGIFKISEDSVVVETNNGRVVIDAENGISVHDSDGNERAVLTDKALDLSALKVNTKVTLPTTLNLTKETQIIDPNGSVNFYGTIATVPAETNCALRINNLLVQTVKMPENYVTGSACACAITLSVGSQKVSSYYDYYAGQGASGDNLVRFSNGKFTDIPLTSNVQIRVNVNLNGNSGWTAQNTPVSVRISCDVCYVMSTESKTVIGSNGFYSMFDGNNMFAVINNKSGQSVFAKGLPTTTSGLSAGQIYKDSSGILRIWGG